MEDYVITASLLSSSLTTPPIHRERIRERIANKNTNSTMTTITILTQYEKVKKVNNYNSRWKRVWLARKQEMKLSFGSHCHCDRAATVRERGEQARKQELQCAPSLGWSTGIIASAIPYQSARPFLL